jgi:hypothetical protein
MIKFINMQIFFFELNPPLNTMSFWISIAFPMFFEMLLIFKIWMTLAPIPKSGMRALIIKLNV